MTTLPSPPSSTGLNLSNAQRTALELRHLLLDLGAPDELLRRVVPRADLVGGEYVYIPPLPVAVAQRLIAATPVPPACGVGS